MLPRRRFGWWAAALSAALIAVASGESVADCEPERGFGGTGRNDERGFGGTGRNDERGFGGTGFWDWLRDGREAGVFGTVTGFGSLCVNGLQIRYDAETRVARDGVRIPSAALRRGQTVRVDTVARGERVEATRIALAPAVSGPVTRVDRAAGRLEVMLQVVEVPRGARAALADIAPGDSIVVHGLRDDRDHIRATLLERAASDSRASVIGRPRELPNGAFAIGRLLVRPVGDAQVTGAASVVTGDFSNREGALVGASVAPALLFAGDARTASVESWVTETLGARFATALVDIDASESNLREGDLEVGDRVWAYGEISDDGVLVANRVEIDPIGGGAPEPIDLDDALHVRDGRDRDGGENGDRDDDDGDHDDNGGDLDDDDGGDLGDIDDSEGPDLDDSGGPDLDDVGPPDLDDLGPPDLDDGGAEDLDD